MDQTPKSVLALDVGEARVGLAIASLEARLPAPLTTLAKKPEFFDQLKEVIHKENIGTLIVGLPRGLDGQETAQTATIRAFARELQLNCNLPIHFQDEALTSQKAEIELQTRGKPYSREDIDSLAATYILEDYLTSN